MKIKGLVTIVRRWSYIVGGSVFASLLSVLVSSVVVRVVFKITNDEAATFIIVPISVVIFIYFFKKLHSESVGYFK